MHMLPIAEAHLHYALCRQAWRAFGWNVRDLKLETFLPITRWSDVAAHFAFYRHQKMDLREAATDLTETLRQTYRIRTSVDANSLRPADARVAHRAALHGLAGVAIHVQRPST